MAIRSDATNFLLHDDAYSSASEILPEYLNFAKISRKIRLPSEVSKGIAKPVYYREICMDRKSLGQFENFFVPWKEQLTKKTD